jgi:hypothetical protein
MKDQFNGNTKKRRPPPHLTGHAVYEFVKDAHSILGKRKRLARILKEMTCGMSINFLGATVLEILRRPSFD